MLEPELKFYADSHISKQVVLQLRRHGVDAVHCAEVNMADANDVAHLEYATQAERAMISGDKDFLRLHHQWMAASREHSGIFFRSEYLQGSE